MTNITVIDSIMGSGKTTYMFDRMKTEGIKTINWEAETVSQPANYIYVTPNKTEVDRVIDACPDLLFTQPLPVRGRKLNHLNDLIDSGRSIATTHALFSMLNADTREALVESDYTLIIDEETEWVSEYEISTDDIRTLVEAEHVYADGENRLRWNHLKYPNYQGSFIHIKNLCDNDNLILVDDSLWIWEFPIKFLSMFKEIFILTYLFEGSLLSSYLQSHDQAYTMKAVRDGQLIDYTGDDSDIKAELIPLVNLVEDPKLNRIGEPCGEGQPLSKRWFERDLRNGGQKTLRLKKNLGNVFRNRFNGQSKKNMWSTHKPLKSKLQDKRYTRGFTPSNLRATNDYIDKQNLAYVLNVFMRTRLINYLQDNGVKPDQDLYALSQMVQWVWRSQIRRGDPINLYIPSERMRALLKQWLYQGSSQGLELAA